MIIDTNKMVGNAKEALKTTKGKVVAGVGVVALAALVAIPAIAHEGGRGDRMEHRGGHEQMMRGDHERGGHDDGIDFTLAQVAGLKMTLPAAVTAAEKATNGRAIDAEIDIAADGSATLNVQLMLVDGTASQVIVDTADGSVATPSQIKQVQPIAKAAQSDEG